MRRCNEHGLGSASVTQFQLRTFFGAKTYQAKGFACVEKHTMWESVASNKRGIPKDGQRWNSLYVGLRLRYAVCAKCVHVLSGIISQRTAVLRVLKRFRRVLQSKSNAQAVCFELYYQNNVFEFLEMRLDLGNPEVSGFPPQKRHIPVGKNWNKEISPMRTHTFNT